MKTIKFRGQRVDNKEWVDGDLIRHYENQRRFIAYDQSAYTYTECGIDRLVTERFCEVIPETVGMFTGLVDKNGVEIYAGDIVSAWSQGAEAIGEVKQRIDGLWLIYPAYQKEMFWGLMPNIKCETTVEVIGNIHDNPELIGKDKNMTNREWLNTLSNEEFNKGIDHSCDEMRKAGECDMHQSCDSCFLDWLKKEREGGKMKETVVMFRKNEEEMFLKIEGNGADIMAALTILIMEFSEHNGYDPKDIVDDLSKGVSRASEETLEALSNLFALLGGNESE